MWGKCVVLRQCFAFQSFRFFFFPGLLEQSLERRTGRSYSPVGNRRMIYFIDDMNMPAVDIYGTVQPHALIRQHLDYGHW